MRHWGPQEIQVLVRTSLRLLRNSEASRGIAATINGRYCSNGGAALSENEAWLDTSGVH